MKDKVVRVLIVTLLLVGARSISALKEGSGPVPMCRPSGPVPCPF